MVTAVLVCLACAGCGGSRHGAGGGHGAGGRGGGLPTYHGHPLNGAEPAVSPALTTAPDGRVVSVGAAAEGIVVVPRAGVVAVAVRDPDRLTLLSTQTGQVVTHVPLEGPARHLGLEGQRTVLVPEAPVDRLLAVRVVARYRTPISHRDIGSRSSVATGSLPHDAVALDGRIFVADEFGHAVSVIAGDRAIGRVSGFVQPGGIAAVTGRVALVDVAADTVTLIDPRTLRRVGAIAAGAGPTHDVAGPGGRLYVADTRGNALREFATRPRLRRLAVVHLPGRPYGIAADPARGRLYVTETGLNRLVELDVRGIRPRIIATFPTVRQPNSVGVDPVDGHVYVAGAAAGVVQELTP